MPESPELFIPWNLLIVVGVAIGALLLIVVLGVLLRRLFRRRQEPILALEPPPPLQLESLPAEGPAAGENPCLELHGTPVKITLIVVASSGRVQVAPSGDFLPSLLENLLPGLEEIIRRDQPETVRWPAQLSSNGFSQTFFSNAKLPGDQGKGTAYSAVAGRFETGGHALLLGLVVCANRPNSIGQETAEHLGQWRNLLRIRRA
ncbi:hypothetical protein [Lignipirellula cremea]|uniref:Uncharacterized protein n=1 Tax=Lignipirellula cremea TaxID=2528010 RepID=A0A518DRD3_9BACT|nr:hypothetical protein [Lignipirellula cremea]QDU94398.1 hypothetical protein Pla8534_21880 [Lignipirellula cremea]